MNLDEYFTSMQAAETKEVLDRVEMLTDEQRLEIFSHFCKYCGGDNPNCQCWNDE